MPQGLKVPKKQAGVDPSHRRTRRYRSSLRVSLHSPLRRCDTLRVPKMVMNFSSSVPHFSSPAWNSVWEESRSVSPRLLPHLHHTWVSLPEH